MLAELINDRTNEYGEAWLVAGRLLVFLQASNLLGDMMASAYGHNFVLILSKLCRLLHNPTHLDSWRDIAGYAQLVVTHLEGYNK